MATNPKKRKVKNLRAAKIIASHDEGCDCLTCIHGICLSPLLEDQSWPEALPPNSDELAKYFTVDPSFKAPFLSWAADRLCMPLPTTSFVRRRELDANTSLSVEVSGNILELFREYANETDARYGLAFKNISIPIHGVRLLLLSENHHLLRELRTTDEFNQWYYLQRGL
jgi:hypothetical protein